MDENEFRQLLELFPIVRSTDYCVSLSLSLSLSHTHTHTHTLAASEFSSQLSGPAPSQELKERQDGCSTEDNNGEAFRLIGRETLVVTKILS
ncbi:hypothetical protein SASPL_126735 [Salvia splendens]|uniref:Uncharacterized protein n=1 Tax=Salvia splendens TaxID=180675 RepID=A0A8X8XJE5_SALSN|nr:hypothetical protein SASPL_126735 [Salvia splendens]